MTKLIFDFDGTIVESGPLIYESLKRHTGSEKSWEELRDLPSHEVVKTLGIGKLELPELILKIRGEFKTKLSQQPIVKDMVESITELKEKGFELHIVSSNSKENIAEFLKFHGLSDAFTSLTSFFTIFGKAHGIGKLLKKLGSDGSDAVYIGDETRDIEAAKKANVRGMAVTWGYNTEKALTPFQPDYIARTPKELVAILCKDIG